MEKVSPLVVPDEEYIPSVHSAKKILDNSDSTLIAEFALEYDDAKEYANRIKRKVKRVHWEKPAVIRIMLDCKKEKRLRRKSLRL